MRPKSLASYIYVCGHECLPVHTLLTSAVDLGAVISPNIYVVRLRCSRIDTSPWQLLGAMLLKYYSRLTYHGFTSISTSGKLKTIAWTQASPPVLQFLYGKLKLTRYCLHPSLQIYSNGSPGVCIVHLLSLNHCNHIRPVQLSNLHASELPSWKLDYASNRTPGARCCVNSHRCHCRYHPTPEVRCGPHFVSED
jgi:hypothetical protein